MYVVLALAVFFYIAYRLYLHFFPPPDINPSGKYVLISGCDSGFGHELAIQLDRKGIHVLAGVYLSENKSKLQNELSANATVFHLDITKQQDIDATYDLVRKKTNTLHAIVNNAGIGIPGYIDWTSLELMRQTMDVNFFGHVAMTKAFLPLLISKRYSRVVNITSIAGIVAAGNMAAYSASKFALEAFSDCLRREMTPWGLHVSIIEPGFMRTPIVQDLNKTFDDFCNKLSTDAQERWGKDYLKEHFQGRAVNLFIKYAEDPMKVVRALEHAVTSTKPSIRYRPGWQATFIFFPLSCVPACVLDGILNYMNKSRLLPAFVDKQLKD
ncbi:unnamed protein product [Adineta ricciae]|uniref:Uncharacterized protein n=1 Tax=Adineta ricciae TaxID=249248 RepID=A0A814PHK3_ADIRI|nr:unnamed protein product [Adineta ricciae]CAF1105787.1 unnamed protein product [Adineta ricciae]